MKQQIIINVMQQMLPHLDNAQMQKLQKVLEIALFNCEITAQMLLLQQSGLKDVQRKR